MSRGWSARSAAERRALAAAFVARHGAELLLDDEGEPPAASGRSRAVPFAGLHAALRRSGPLPGDVTEGLRADPALREDFVLLLWRSARQHLPRAAAAAGRGGLNRREAGGFVLRIVASRSGGDQVYLLIDFPEEIGLTAAEAGPEDDAETNLPEAARPDRPGSGHETPNPASPGTAPAWIVVRTAPGEFLKRDLPPPESRTVRLLATADDPLIRAVREPGSEIFLL